MSYGLLAGQLRDFHRDIQPENRVIGLPQEWEDAMDDAMGPVQRMMDLMREAEQRARS